MRIRTFATNGRLDRLQLVDKCSKFVFFLTAAAAVMQHFLISYVIDMMALLDAVALIFGLCSDFLTTRMCHT